MARRATRRAVKDTMVMVNQLLSMIVVHSESDAEGTARFRHSRSIAKGREVKDIITSGYRGRGEGNTVRP